MTKETERLKEIEEAKEELRTKLEGEGITAEDIKQIQEEARKLSDEEKEIRTKLDIRGLLTPGELTGQGGTGGMDEKEQRAKEFKESGKMEFRALLASGKIAEPTKVSGVNGLAETIGSIVDDIKAVALTGNGSYTVAYKKTEAAAADVTDGKEIGGTGATFDYVTINPAEWGITDEISNQVAKLTPVDYMDEIRRSAVIALRAKAEEKIMANVLKSTLLEKVYSMALDADYLRNIVLGFKSIAGKGGVKLYINREDLITLGKVRGTNEKKALYEIKFDAGSNMTGTISEGGVAVPFSVTDQIAKGKQLFGQPQTVEMPMWDNYRIETNDGGDYFRKNMIGIRGIQTANADLCALKGMQLISQAAQA